MFTLLTTLALAGRFYWSGRVAVFWVVRGFTFNTGIDRGARHCARVLRTLLRGNHLGHRDLRGILHIGRVRALRLRYTIGPWTLQEIEGVANSCGRHPIEVFREVLA